MNAPTCAPMERLTANRNWSRLYAALSNRERHDLCVCRVSCNLSDFFFGRRIGLFRSSFNSFPFPRFRIVAQFLQRVSAACYAARCISLIDSFCLSVCLSHAGIMSKRLKLRSWGLPMTLIVFWRLTSPQNFKGNTGSEGAEWERDSKNRHFNLKYALWTARTMTLT